MIYIGINNIDAQYNTQIVSNEFGEHTGEHCTFPFAEYNM